MEEFINDIYNKSKVIVLVKKMLETCRKRQYKIFLEQWKELVEPMADFCRETAQQNEALGVKIWDMLQDIKGEIEKSSFIKTADLLENVIPYMYEAVSLFGDIDVVEGEYRLFSSRSGFLNLELGKNGEAVYSDNDPVWDRYGLAKSLFTPTTRQIFIVGCGLGYLPWQFYQVADEAVEIHIFDIDSNIVEFAKSYGVLSYIPQEHLQITVEKDFYKMINKISQLVDKYDESEVIFYIEKYFEYYLSKEEKAVLNSLMIAVQTKINFRDIVEQNYYKNHMAVAKSLYDLDFEKYSRRWIVVGGGPSFDENIEYIKEQKGKKTIIAASTIWRRMVSEGIEPDFISVIDPQRRTYGHMEGIDNHNPAMVITEYANWRFAQNYLGEKYWVPCETAYYANFKRKDRILEFKGTVTSFSIEIAAYANAESVELIGVDLAFPNGNSHATGTMDFKTVDSADLVKVKSVDGKDVYTSSVFSVYITDIEEQLKRHPKITFYNLSKHGALIRGCKNI